MTNRVWTYYFARKFSPSRFEVVMRVFFSAYYRRRFGLNPTHALAAPHGGTRAIFYVEREWTPFARRLYQRTCRDLTTFQRYVRLIRQTQRRSLTITKRIVAQPLRRVPWDTLRRSWRAWDRAHFEHFVKPIWIPFIIEPLLVADASAALHTILIRRRIESQAQHYQELVFAPDQPNAITQERQSFLALAIRLKRGRLAGAKLAASLHAHAEQFRFIPCYDIIDAPWTSVHFRAELRKLSRQPLAQLQAEARELRTKFRARRRAFQQALRALRPQRRERELLVMAHALAFIKDDRDDYRRRLSYAIQPLFHELARRGRLPRRAPGYLLYDEMEHWFRTGRVPVSRRELRQRMDRFVVLGIRGKPFTIFSGSSLTRFLAQQRFAGTDRATTSVRGIVANHGVARGRARIVKTKHDLRRVKAGDILVAVTTNPDYLPAMRRCKAFVTDEGGLTAHAAIVARELNLPCIVGTRIATQVFQDGDLIEVNATKGLARKA